MTCDESYSITIGNMIFDIDNPIGEATIFGGASNGCDSIIQVSIEFSEEIQDEYTYSTCDESFSIIIGGQTFDINNPIGQVSIPDGSAGSCDTIVTVNLSYEDFFAEFDLFDEDCEGMNGGIQFNNISSGLSLIYTIGTETVAVSLPELPYLVSLDAGEYQLEVSNEQGCISLYNIEIFSSSNYNSSLTATLISENSYQLNFTSDGNVVDFEWSPTVGLSCTDCQNPIATINASTEFFVNLIFEDGCIESLSIILDFEEQPEITLPNIFTPNGDGANEIFFFSTLDDNVIISSFYIFDRWGSKVFSQENIPANDPLYGWDGKFNGNDAAQGVYVYYIKSINPITEEITEYTGDLTLIR
jgi:gliding motility-associated-like protein